MKVEVPGMGVVEFPDDMTEDQISAAIKANMPKTAPAKINADPTGGFWENTAAGAGKAVADAGRGVSQLVRMLGPQYRASADAMGLPNQADVDESRRLDAPLMKTGGGITGNVLGNLAMTLPTAGAGSSLPAAAGVGGAFGAIQPTATGESRLLNTGVGMLGGVGGQLAANRIGTTLANRAATAANGAQKAVVAKTANQAGYVIPPEDLGGGVMTRLASGLSGKIKTAQEASARNQTVTTDLVRAELGIPKGTPLDLGTLNTIRSQAGQAYDAVANAGVITPPKTYSDALDKIAAPFVKASQGFPNAKPSPIIAEIDSLRSPQFDAASAVAKIKELRGNADAAYASGNKDLGKALKSGADALEGAIDSHLVTIGAPADLLSNFRQARQTIAKTYTVQKALNPQTGEISAPVLARELAKGRPLSGNLKAVAEVSAAFPKATQALKEAPKSLSPLDFGAAGLGLVSSGGNPLAAAGLLARPAARAALLSGLVQRRAVNATPGNGVLGLLEPGAVPLGLLPAAYLGQQ